MPSSAHKYIHTDSLSFNTALSMSLCAWHNLSQTVSTALNSWLCKPDAADSEYQPATLSINYQVDLIKMHYWSYILCLPVCRYGFISIKAELKADLSVWFIDKLQLTVYVAHLFPYLMHPHGLNLKWCCLSFFPFDSREENLTNKFSFKARQFFRGQFTSERLW